MLEFFWGCLVTGVLLALVTVIFGEVIDSFFDGVLSFLSIDGADILNPMVLVGGVTIFGGMGIILTEYTSLWWLTVVALSLLSTIFCSVLLYFFYLKPMKNAENSIGYSIQEFSGKIAEVTVPIPAAGYGEVLIKVGATNTNQIAASFDHEVIQRGTRVVVVDVRHDTLYVSRFENT